MIEFAFAVVLSLAPVATTQPPPSSPPTTPPTTPPALSLEVSKTDGLDPDGETVTVTGDGYDESRGIYVAFCVVPPPGQTPTPCGGGVDLEGASGSSKWISSAPPDYGVGLAEPYGPGGSFTVQLDVNAMLRDDIDCRKVQCAVVTRADHTRLADRTLDVIVPVFFATGPLLTLPPLPEAAGEASPTPVATTAPSVVIVGTSVAPARGGASSWPVWIGTAVALVALAAALPRRRRAGAGRQR